MFARLLPLLLVASSGCGATTEALYTFELRSDKHLINTDRGKFMLLDEDTSCLDLDAIVEWSDAAPTDLHDALLLHDDRDLCDYYDASARQLSAVVGIDELPGLTTVAFVGYNQGSTEPSLVACIHGAQTTSLLLTLAARPGLDVDEPARWPSVDARCSR